MNFARTPFAIAIVLAAAACAPGITELPTEQTDDRDAALDAGTVFIVTRQDQRKCAYPMCGGVFVKAVNKAKTTCLDGTKQADCYVAELDFDALGWSDDQAADVRGSAVGGAIVLTGTIEPLESHPMYGRLAAHAASEAHTDATATGTYYSVEDNGIVCITAPCPSVSASKLNSTVVKQLTDVDLSGLGLSADEIDATMTAVHDGGVIMTGQLKTSGAKKKLVVSQVFDAIDSEVPGATCVDACGGISADQTCWCDDACTYYGDCCADLATACE